MAFRLEMPFVKTMSGVRKINRHILVIGVAGNVLFSKQIVSAIQIKY
ncbi:hypothetical protein FH603_1259 [Spirosoma sp. LMG 31447]|uniref:Uncharacterized protein n=1 Tax=Spirosoma utsteinense TaxID=2585773 RepID=A0ABR6W4F3_9BACT|nr:hypothetical protein [Spirosoma utsteinense]